MNYSKISCMLSVITLISLQAADTNKDNASARQASANTNTRVIQWPYSGNNSGPSACSKTHFLKWVGNDLTVCEWGIPLPCFKTITFDKAVTSQPDWMKEVWQATLAQDTQKVAVCTYATNRSGEAVNVFLCSLGQKKSEILDTFTIKWPGKCDENFFDSNTVPVIIFDNNNQLHYAEKSATGFDLVNYNTKNRTTVAISAFFLSLLKQKDKINAAFTNDENDVMIYDTTTKSFLPPLKGHESEVLHVSASATDQRVISCANTNVRLWDLQTATCLKSFNAIPSNIMPNTFIIADCCVAGDNNEYIVGFGPDGVNVWDTRLNKDTPVRHFMPGRAFSRGSASGRYITAGGGNQDQFLILKEKSDPEQTTQPAPTQTASLLSWLWNTKK